LWSYCRDMDAQASNHAGISKKNQVLLCSPCLVEAERRTDRLEEVATPLRRPGTATIHSPTQVLLQASFHLL